MKQLVKAKVGDKWRTFGNITEGNYGPRLGMRVTAELRELLASKQDGEWANFSVFVDDREANPQEANREDIHAPLDEETPPF